MTSADLHRSAYSAGWLTSLGLHAALALGALAAAQRITLTPQIPFTWQVSMVAAPSSPLEPSASLPTNPETPHLTPLPNTSAATSSNSSLTTAETIRPTPHPPRPTPPIASPEPATEAIREASSTAQAAPQSLLQEAPAEPDPISVAASPHPMPVQAEGLSPAPSPPMGAGVSSAPHPDYTWLSETILRRMEELKKYPAEARLNQAQGKVVLKAVIRSDGGVENVEVAKSSGYQSLDQAAVDLLKLAGPFQLTRPLEKPQLTVKIPMSYRLE